MRMTRSQRFAIRAMGEIAAFSEGLKAEGKAETAKTLKKDYLTRANSFPALVMQSGLVQSTGFLIAKSQTSNDAHSDEQESSAKKHEAYSAYALSLAKVLGCDSIGTLHDEAIGQSGTADYRQLTRDVLQAATHLRCYAQIELRADKASAAHTSGDA